MHACIINKTVLRNWKEKCQTSIYVSFIGSVSYLIMCIAVVSKLSPPPLSQHKPNLALCSYQQCLRSSSNVAVLPALHNCATVYKTMGNAEAEMGMRKILLEVCSVPLTVASY